MHPPPVDSQISFGEQTRAPVDEPHGLTDFQVPDRLQIDQQIDTDVPFTDLSVDARIQ